MSGCHVPTETIEERLERLEEHKNRQIDENRKISRRVDELEEYLREIKLLYSNPLQQQVWQESISTRLSELEEWTRKDEDIIYERLEKLEGLLDFTKNLLNTKIHLDEKLGTHKKPYCCPVCADKGYWNSIENSIACGGQCKACEGKGIVWG